METLRPCETFLHATVFGTELTLFNLILVEIILFLFVFDFYNMPLFS